MSAKYLRNMKKIDKAVTIIKHLIHFSYKDWKDWKERT